MVTHTHTQIQNQNCRHCSFWSYTIVLSFIIAHQRSQKQTVYILWAFENRMLGSLCMTCINPWPNTINSTYQFASDVGHGVHNVLHPAAGGAAWAPMRFMTIAMDAAIAGEVVAWGWSRLPLTWESAIRWRLRVMAIVIVSIHIRTMSHLSRNCQTWNWHLMRILTTKKDACMHARA